MAVSLDDLTPEYKRAYAKVCAPRIMAAFARVSDHEMMAEYERVYANELAIIAETEDALYERLIDAQVKRYEELTVSCPTTTKEEWKSAGR